jgi:hypothetical protein
MDNTSLLFVKAGLIYAVIGVLLRITMAIIPHFQIAHSYVYFKTNA